MSMKTTIIEKSGRDFTKKELAIIKTSLQSCVDINSATEGDKSIVVTVAASAVLEIENDRSKGEKVYQKILIVDNDGIMYITGSPSFMEAFRSIMEVMEDEDPSSWGLEIFQMASNNYKGKSFITCKVI